MWFKKPEAKDNADYNKLKQEVVKLSEKLSAIEKEAYLVGEFLHECYNRY